MKLTKSDSKKRRLISLFRNFKWDLIFAFECFKYKSGLFIIEQKTEYFFYLQKIKKYCAKGWHNTHQCSLEITLRARKQKVEYLKCSLCEKKFFATLKDKNKYLSMTRKRMRRIL